MIFDSLSMLDVNVIHNNILYYLNAECNEKLRLRYQFTAENMPVINLDVPQQTNGYDCGIYLLQNVESFFLVN